MAKSNRRSRGRRTASRRAPTATIQLSQSESWDRQIAIRSDRITVVSKILLNENYSSTTNSFPISAIALSAIAAQYQKWRILKMLFVPRMVNTIATSGGAPTTDILAVGFADDPSVQVNTFSLVTSLRVSTYINTGANDVGVYLKNDSDELLWKPTDPEKWYYTLLPAGETVPDERWDVPVQLVTATRSGGQSVNYFASLYFTIEFQGQI